jgi:hypothetical protein
MMSNDKHAGTGHYCGECMHLNQTINDECHPWCDPEKDAPRDVQGFVAKQDSELRRLREGIEGAPTYCTHCDGQLYELEQYLDNLLKGGA